MGTRGTCGFMYKGEPKLGYNHFDSYPDGLGVQMIDMIIWMLLYLVMVREFIKK